LVKEIHKKDCGKLQMCYTYDYLELGITDIFNQSSLTLFIFTFYSLLHIFANNLLLKIRTQIVPEINLMFNFRERSYIYIKLYLFCTFHLLLTI